ncbi:MAG: hypothetical protein WCQ32_03145 [bacterium]
MKITIFSNTATVTIPKKLLNSFIAFLRNNKFELVDYIDSIEVLDHLDVLIQVHQNQVLFIKKKIEIWNSTNHPRPKKITELKIRKGKFLATITISGILYRIGTEQDNFLSALELAQIYQQEDQPIVILNDKGEKVTRST